MSDMNDNEDYLDSLLKAASSNNDPDSAINKVREMSRREEKSNDPGPETAEAPQETEKTEPEVKEPVNTDAELRSLFAAFSGKLPEAEAPLPVKEDAGSIVETPEAFHDDEITGNAVENVTEDSENTSGIDDASEPADNSDPQEELLNAADDLSELDALLNMSKEDGSEPKASPVENEPTIGEDLGNGELAVDMSELDSLLNSMDENKDTAGESSESTEADISNLSEDEINDMIKSASDTSAETSEAPKEEMEIDINDLEALESEFGIYEKNPEGGSQAAETSDSGETAGELDELSSLLAQTENGGADIEDILNAAVNQSEEENRRKTEKKENVEESSEDDPKNKGKKNKKDKKGKKDKKAGKGKKKDGGEAGEGLNPEKGLNPENADIAEALSDKPKGKFAKFIDFLTDDGEEGKEEELLNPTEGTEVTGENKEILDEVDAEGDEGKGKKKKKDKKAKKDKKGKGDKDKDAAADDEAGDEEGEESGKKKKKPKKEKKEKKPLELDIDTGKPLNKRNVLLIFVLCLSVLAGILIIVNIVPGRITKQAARDAYYKGDYETTYVTFYGDSKLSDSDQELFNKSEIILRMQHKYDAFSAYLNIGMRTEALDQLLQAVDNYDRWKAVAVSTGCENAFDAQYAKVTAALAATFGLTEEKAKEIIALDTDLEYSLMCESVSMGTEYIDPTEPLPGDFVPPEEEPVYEDLLGEEELK